MLNLGPIINQGNPGGRGVSSLGNPGEERGLEVQEIWEEGGGVKNSCHPSGGVWIFSGITQLSATNNSTAINSNHLICRV